MNIPHLAPVKFAQEVLSCDNDNARVKCMFPQTPTLAMFFEAAAQSSAAFAQDNSKIGFVISLKNITLHESTAKVDAIVNIHKKTQLGSICEFEFKVFCEEEKIHFVSGILTVMIKN